MTNLSPEIKLIFLCLRLELEESTKNKIKALLALSLDWKRIKEIADGQRITPLLYSTLNQLPQKELIPQEIFSSMRQLYLRNLSRNIVMEKEVLRFLELVKAKNLNIIFLKGFTLIQVLYRNPALREMIDVDILIKKEDLSLIKDLLFQLNYQIAEKISRYSEKYHYEVFFSKRFSAKQIMFLDVHWRLLGNRPYRLELPGVFERAQKISIGEQETLCLSWEDTFFSLALHIRKHIRDLTLNSVVDVAEWLKLKRNELDWGYLKEIARQNHCMVSLFFSLYLARELFEIDIPLKIIKTFWPNIIKRRIIKTLINKENFFNFKKWKATIVRFLLFDSLIDFFVYLLRVSFWERFVVQNFLKLEII
jgi:hypothetical protein